MQGGVNLYSYVSNDPINKTDPLGLYEIDVHYYLTYYLARKTSCFTDSQSRAIANADQGTDEVESTLPDFNKRYANKTYHALHEGASPGVGSQHLWDMATKPFPDFTYFGRYLHYLQDTYSHAGFDSPVYGHALAGHKYDQPSSDPARALRMAKSTWDSLIEFAGKLGCKCNPNWSPEMVNTILEFAMAPSSSTPRLNTIDSQGGLHDFFKTNPPWYLERKRLILGVPRR